MGVAEKAAPAFERMPGLRLLYGVAPEVRFVEIAALVDNGVGAVA
jgi:hypothetical protein